MNFLNNNVDTGVINGDTSTVNNAQPTPVDGPKYMEGEDNEIVNEEDQNQVINAQPLEEFISENVNKESTNNEKEKLEGVEE